VIPWLLRGQPEPLHATLGANAKESIVLDYLVEAKPAVASALETILHDRSARYGTAIAGMGPDVARRLLDFSLRGKLLRGCLVRLGYELAAGRAPEARDAEAVALAGAAMELFQSGLLVHDDIMDRDRSRRGEPTLHVRYEEELERSGYAEPAHYGEALGICAGDIAFFAAFDALASLPVSDRAARRVMIVAASELSLVGVAQMRDVANGAHHDGAHRAHHDGAPRPRGSDVADRASFDVANSDIDEAEVMSLYRYKTARYTFSLPLALGAAIAEAQPSVSQALEDSGERLGLVFQLKDDELGLFASEAELGKPIGADIREDKKTPHRLRLFSKADPALRARLASIFGSRTLSPHDLDLVRDSLERLGVRAELAAELERLAAEARKLAEPFLADASPAAGAAFLGLVDYSLSRRA